MPTWSPASPRTRPTRKLGSGRLPEDKVQRIALVWCDLDACAGKHVLRSATRKLAIRGKGRHVKQDMILFDIGIPVCDQPLYQGNDRGDVLGDARLQVRNQHAQRPHVLVVGIDVARSNGADRHALRRRARVDLVIQIGEVASVDHFCVLLAQ